MIITPKDISVLRAVACYYVLTANQIRRICFPHHKTGRGVRDRLARLVRHGYVAKLRSPVAFPHGNSGPVYYPVQKGLDQLASWYDDESYLNVCVNAPRRDLVFHWLMISEIHMLVAHAAAQSQVVRLERWINEWETVVGRDGQETFTLHSVLSIAPPLSCSPDAGFLLAVGDHRRVILLEADRGTSGVRQVAAKKYRGYHELRNRQGHRRFFPETTFEDFTVLCVTTDAGRRDRLARAISARDGRELWLFVDVKDLSAETLFHADITFDHRGRAGALVTRSPGPVSKEAELEAQSTERT